MIFVWHRGPDTIEFRVLRLADRARDLLARHLGALAGAWSPVVTQAVSRGSRRM